MSSNYVYLLQEREFIRTNENIYKVGRTEQENTNRFYQYPKGSKLLYQSSCEDCRKCESLILQKFRESFVQRKDIGNEYFEGNFREMKKIMTAVIESEEYKNSNFMPTEEKISNQNKSTTETNNNEVKRYQCNNCNFFTNKKFNYVTHMQSKKHEMKKMPQKEKNFICNNCNREMFSRTSLWRHKNACKVSRATEETDETLLLRIIESNNNIMLKMMNLIEKL